MRRILACLTALAVIAPVPGHAQSNDPPHAWLFGTWTGGLFPVPSTMTPQACFGQPVVVFTRDVVLRATLIEATYTQRVIETARTDPGTTDFRFAPAGVTPAGLLGLAGPAAQVGFGCENGDVLHVRRRSDNEISFPGCPEFSYPLVRCGSR